MCFIVQGRSTMFRESEPLYKQRPLHRHHPPFLKSPNSKHETFHVALKAKHLTDYQLSNMNWNIKSSLLASLAHNTSPSKMSECRMLSNKTGIYAHLLSLKLLESFNNDSENRILNPRPSLCSPESFQKLI